MAILQISRISHRKGLQENLPQLTGAELGWAIDEQRLFIGNGLLEDGAPVIGNTEILTEFSDLLSSAASTYIYQGAEGGYIVNTGANPSESVERTIQNKLDEQISVRDFGATGNGLTDDTDAINRAYFELFTGASNVDTLPQRRVLHFPAGMYRISGSLNMPSHSISHGDGISSTIIMYDPPSGSDTILNNATPAILMTGANCELANLAVQSRVNNNLIEITESALLYRVRAERIENLLSNNYALPSLSDNTVSTTAIKINASNVTLSECATSSTTFGVLITNAYNIKIENTGCSKHFKAAFITNSTATNISRSIFNEINSEAIVADTSSSLVSSSFNVFTDVANGTTLSAPGTAPITPVINFEAANNVSIGDLFTRNDTDNKIFPRIEINGEDCIAFDSTSAMLLGQYKRYVGKATQVLDNAVDTLFTIDQNNTFKVDYTISRGTEQRTGTLESTNNGVTVEFSDSFNASTDLQVELLAVLNGTNGTDITVDTTAGTGDISITYSVVRM